MSETFSINLNFQEYQKFIIFSFLGSLANYSLNFKSIRKAQNKLIDKFLSFLPSLIRWT